MYILWSLSNQDTLGTEGSVTLGVYIHVCAVRVMLVACRELHGMGEILAH